MQHIFINSIDLLFRIIEFAIFLECILSWIPSDGTRSIMEIINIVTGPILEPFRNLQYKFLGNTPIDISPIIAIFAIEVIKRILFGILI